MPRPVILSVDHDTARRLFRDHSVRIDYVPPREELERLPGWVSNTHRPELEGRWIIDDPDMTYERLAGLVDPDAIVVLDGGD